MAVNKTFLESLESSASLISHVDQHLIAAGWKRIRTLVTLLLVKMCGDRVPARAVRLGACIEFIHAATRLYNHVVDESTLRRGLQTANALWGNKLSVLVGDFLFGRTFQLMETPFLSILLKL